MILTFKIIFIPHFWNYFYFLWFLQYFRANFFVIGFFFIFFLKFIRFTGCWIGYCWNVRAQWRCTCLRIFVCIISRIYAFSHQKYSRFVIREKYAAMTSAYDDLEAKLDTWMSHSWSMPFLPFAFLALQGSLVTWKLK